MTSIDSAEIDVICEFIEVAFHNILFVRGIYPEKVFKKQKKYNIPVNICRHPDVSSYVTDCVASIRTLLANDHTKKVVLNVIKNENRPVEKFVFLFGRINTANEFDERQILRLEQDLRSALLKLTTSDPQPSANATDQGCTFTVEMHTDELSLQQLSSDNPNESFPWVKVDQNLESDTKHVADSRIVALKTIKANKYQVQIFIEETNDG
ncbi:MAD2L2 (predicted) [Pycnogonum litorale]